MAAKNPKTPKSRTTSPDASPSSLPDDCPLSGKQLLVEQVYLNSDLTRNQVHDLIGRTLHSIKMIVIQHGRLELRDFGTFEKKGMKARVARNPSTGESIEIPARNGLKFKAAAKFKALARSAPIESRSRGASKPRSSADGSPANMIARDDAIGGKS